MNSLKPPCYFRGRRDEQIDRFLVTFETFAKAANWSDTDMTKMLPMYLKDEAFHWFVNNRFPYYPNLSYTTIKERLISQFCHTEERSLREEIAHIYVKINTLSQKLESVKQKLDSFTHDMKKERIE